MRHIIVINGGAGVGKDTFCSLVGQYVPSAVLSAIDPIKGIFAMCGIPYNKTEKDRAALSDMKDILDRYNFTRTYIRQICQSFKFGDAYSPQMKVLFVHMRDPEDIEWLRTQFDHVLTVLVVRDSVPKVQSNHADKNVGMFNYDYTVSNNGSIADLDRFARQFGELLNH